MIDSNAKIHSHSLIDKNVAIGARTRVWAFSHILSGAEIGADCNICDHTFIEGKVVLGNRVTVKCGVYLWDGLTAEDDVFIGPAAVFTNDLKPRSRQYPDSYAPTLLKQGSSIGANATIIAGVTIGKWAFVGAGSVVTKDIPDYAAVWGNPARFQYWMCQCTEKMFFNDSEIFACRCGQTYEIDNKINQIKLCR